MKYFVVRRSLGVGTSSEEQKVVALLSEYREHTRWIITDRPIFAFYANILVPPEIALVSHKRQFTQDREEDYLINKIEEYKPELILLGRFRYYGPKAISYIEKNYHKVYQADPPTHKLLQYRTWVPRRIYWIPKFITFLNRERCFNMPILRGGYFKERQPVKIKLSEDNGKKIILYEKRDFEN